MIHPSLSYVPWTPVSGVYIKLVRWHHPILDNASRIPVCGLIRMVYEMTENWYFLFWVFPNNKKQIDNKKKACQLLNSTEM